MKNAVMDIKYRGFITPRGLRFIALIAMTLSQIALILVGINKAMGLVNPEYAQTHPVLNIFNLIGNLTFPLLLVSSFAIVFSKPDKIVKSLIINFIVAAVTIIFCAFILPGIILQMVEMMPGEMINLIDTDAILDIIAENPNLLANIPGIDISSFSPVLTADMLGELTGVLKEIDLTALVNDYMPVISSGLTKYILVNYVNINVFWDLSLCSLFYFFITYTPEKIKNGKLFLFRCCSVFPVLYIAGSVFIVGLLKVEMMDMPVWSLALLTNKKLPAYLLFFLIVVFFKYKEVEHLAAKGNHSSYISSLKTNRMSLQFSIYLCICIAVLSLIDFALSGITNLKNWGIGTSYEMVIAIPFILLFSYSKVPKHKWPDAIIPLYYILNYIFVVSLLFAAVMALPQFMQMAIEGF